MKLGWLLNLGILEERLGLFQLFEPLYKLFVILNVEGLRETLEIIIKTELFKDWLVRLIILCDSLWASVKNNVSGREEVLGSWVPKFWSVFSESWIIFDLVPYHDVTRLLTLVFTEIRAWFENSAWWFRSHIRCFVGTRSNANRLSVTIIIINFIIFKPLFSRKWGSVSADSCVMNVQLIRHLILFWELKLVADPLAAFQPRFIFEWVAIVDKFRIP